VSVVILTHFTAVLVLVCVAVDFGPAWTTLVELASPERTGPVRWAGPRLAGAPSWVDLAWGVAAGLGGGFGSMLLFRGLGRGSMAVVAPITAAGAASVPVLFGLATGEALTPLAIAGIGLALAAIVLVSWTGEAPDDAPSDDSGDELTVPEGWVERYGDVERGAPGLPGPDPDELIFSGPVPAGGAVTMTAAPATIGAHAAAVTSAPRALAGELGITVRSITAVVMTLMLALMVAAGGIAAGPVAELVDGQPLTPAHIAMLGFAVATLLVAAVGLRLSRPLFALIAGVTDAEAAADGMADLVERDRLPAWRRILLQPGLPEALLSGLGFGAFYVCIYRPGASAGHWPLVSARGVSVVMFAAGALLTRTPLLPERASRRGVVVAGVLDAAAAVLFVLATRAGLLSVGAVLASLYPAVTVVLARSIGKEHISRRQFAGLALALAAVALLAL
jgi:drug/metabolite transporter (DMT)-like permease